MQAIKEKLSNISAMRKEKAEAKVINYYLFTFLVKIDINSYAVS